MSRIDDPNDPIEAKILTDIGRLGWSAIGVSADELGPSMVYSIGFQETYGQPEVLIMGLDIDTMHSMLARVAECFLEGMGLDDDRISTEIIEGYPCVFKAVPPDFYRDYVGYDLWYYGGHNFQLSQCVWPDEDGHFPWDAEAGDELRRFQPVLWQTG